MAVFNQINSSYDSSLPDFIAFPETNDLVLWGTVRYAKLKLKGIDGRVPTAQQDQ